jgi:hypothetical protein
MLQILLTSQKSSNIAAQEPQIAWNPASLTGDAGTPHPRPRRTAWNTAKIAEGNQKAVDAADAFVLAACRSMSRATGDIPAHIERAGFIRQFSAEK